MGKIKINTELLKLMDDYNLFMSSHKSTSMPMQIAKVKGNHTSSLHEEKDLDSVDDFGETVVDCEVRDKNPNNYSFQILTDRITSRVLARFDEGNGTHRNNCKDIPLEQQMITTPHFHKYDVCGRFIAYKTKELKGVGTPPLSIQDGLRFFCNEEKIFSNNGAKIGVEVNEIGALPLECDKDPLNGINF